MTGRSLVSVSRRPEHPPWRAWIIPLLALLSGTCAGAPTGLDLAWHDRDGRVLGTVPNARAPYADLWLAADEQSVMAVLENGELRRVDLASGRSTRAQPPGPPPDPARRLTHRSRGWHVFEVRSPGPAPGLWVAPREAGAMRPYGDPGRPARRGQLSADERWMAWVSEEAGLAEVYVSTFPDPAVARWLISLPAGGDRPVWRADSLELFYWEPAGRLMAVALKKGDRFVQPARPRLLFEEPAFDAPPFAVTRDGRRVLLAGVPSGGGQLAGLPPSRDNDR